MRPMAIAVATLLVACSAAKKEKPAGLGRRLVSGQMRSLAPSPGGTHLAYLDHCIRPSSEGLSLDAATCDLQVVEATGGAPKRLAREVSTLSMGFVWNPRRDMLGIAALSEYDFGRGIGTLRYALAKDGALQEAAKLGEEVSFYGFVPVSGVLGFVSRGQLSVVWPGAPQPETIEGVAPVATFELNPRWERGAESLPGPAIWLLARRPLTAGGDLLGLVDPRRISRLGSQVGDYGFSPDGTGLVFTSRRGDAYDLLRAAAVHVGGEGQTPLESVGGGVQGYSFSRHDGALAFVGDVLPGKPGNLYVAKAGGSVKLATKVGDFRWAAGAPLLAWLQDYNFRTRSGTLAAGGLGLKPEILGRGVREYDISADGTTVAFLEHVTTGTYSVDLKLARLTSGTPVEIVAQGAFGFSFSPDGKTLYFRANCVGQGEACDLRSIPVAATLRDTKPTLLAEGIKSFEFAPGLSDRLLVTWTRNDTAALDIAVLQGNRLISVDKAAAPGSIFFVGPESNRLAYIVTDPNRAGVYVAELPVK